MYSEDLDPNDFRRVLEEYEKAKRARSSLLGFFERHKTFERVVDGKRYLVVFLKARDVYGDLVGVFFGVLVQNLWFGDVERFAVADIWFKYDTIRYDDLWQATLVYEWFFKKTEGAEASYDYFMRLFARVLERGLVSLADFLVDALRRDREFLGLLYNDLGDEFIDELSRNPRLLSDFMRENFVVGDRFILVRDPIRLIVRGDGSILFYDVGDTPEIFRSEITPEEEPELFSLFSALFDVSKDLFSKRSPIPRIYGGDEEMSLSSVKTYVGGREVIFLLTNFSAAEIFAIVRSDGKYDLYSLVRDKDTLCSGCSPEEVIEKILKGASEDDELLEILTLRHIIMR
ncbi:MAG: hypothetical protein C0179_05830, partial [Fervidicoccus sp.]